MSIRVLIIDDDEQIRRALSASFTRAGFTVTAADDGAAGIELAATLEVDTVIVDFNLKTMTGDVVVRHFKARFGARVYCAVLSGEDCDHTRAICLAAGADDVFLKPASPRQLRERLAEAVAELHRAA